MLINRLLRILAPLIVFISTSCEKTELHSMTITDICSDEFSEQIPLYIPQKMFQLSELGIKPFSANSQGMDIFDDKIMFQAGNDHNVIYAIDLINNKLIGSLELSIPNNKACHMNNINCGPFLEKDDQYPVLYLSQTVDSHSCFVLRINNDFSSYEIIQTIRYIGKDHYLNDCSFDWFIDYPNNIYTFGKYNGDAEKREIIRFNLPPLGKAEVELTDDDILDFFVLNNQSIYQGSKIINDLLYSPVGVGNAQYPSRLIIIDLRKKTVIKDTPISCGEPEAIGKFQSGAIISSQGRNPTYYFIRI